MTFINARREEERGAFMLESPGVEEFFLIQVIPVIGPTHNTAINYLRHQNIFVLIPPVPSMTLIIFLRLRQIPLD